MSRKKKKRKKQKPTSFRKNSTKGYVPSNKSPFGIDSQLQEGVRYHQSGRLEKAEKVYRKILKIEPDHPECLYLLGVIEHQRENTEIAVDLYNRAIQNNPDSPFYHNSLGAALQNLGRLEEAISCCDRALRLNPDFAQAYYNMGTALKDQRRFDEATSCFQKAVQLIPNYAEAYANMGLAFQEQNMLDQAIVCYQKALEIKPDSARIFCSLGSAFREVGRSDEATSCFQKALKLRPNFEEAQGCMVEQLQRTCDWKALKTVGAKLSASTKISLDSGAKTHETPFVSLVRQADPSLNFAVASSWSREIAETASASKISFSFDDRRPSKTKLTVGYLSNDFRNHAVAHVMGSLFGLHDRSRFQVYCYSYGPDDGSDYRKRIEQDCDKFADIRDRGHSEAATRIFEDKVDILVDLNGHTGGARLEICAFRPAPIQVTYLGFPGTTGAGFFDYIITDRIVTPDSAAIYYSENFVYMPHCYMVNDHTQEISNKDWKKVDFGLPEQSFVFCSFANTYKIEPVIFDVWMGILRQVPESVLWFRRVNKTAENNLRAEAEKKGISCERFVFSGKLPSKTEHLARLSLADLALDTRIYNGHATTSDALWAGVPVIALKGSHFASRASESFLTAIGLTELIVDTLEEYQDLAVRLARNPGELQAMRQRLARNRTTKPLFDTPRFARNLEKAYGEMWKIFLAGEKPRQIEVVRD